MFTLFNFLDRFQIQVARGKKQKNKKTKKIEGKYTKVDFETSSDFSQIQNVIGESKERNQKKRKKKKRKRN